MFRISVSFSRATSLQGRLPRGSPSICFVSSGSELSAVHPHAVHDDGKLSRQGNFGAFCAATNSNPHRTRSDVPLSSTVHADRKAEGQQVSAHIGFEFFGSVAHSPDIFPRRGATATEFERYPLKPSLHLLKSHHARGARAEIDVA